ncbi:MAG: hypothetical protein WC314_01295 [Vulcanimicrobiota bacterium]
MMTQILSFFQGGIPIAFSDAFVFIAALHILAFCLVPRAKAPESR